MISSMHVAYYSFAISLLLLAIAVILMRKNKANSENHNLKEEPEAGHSINEKNIIINEKKISKRYVDGFDTISKAIEKYPILEDFLYYNGVKSVKNKIVMATFAKKTTIASIAKALGKNQDEFLDSINRYIEDSMNL